MDLLLNFSDPLLHRLPIQKYLPRPITHPVLGCFHRLLFLVSLRSGQILDFFCSLLLPGADIVDEGLEGALSGALGDAACG